MLTSSRQRKAARNALVAPTAVPVAKANRTQRAGADAAAKAVLATKRNKRKPLLSVESRGFLHGMKKGAFLAAP